MYIKKNIILKILILSLLLIYLNNINKSKKKFTGGIVNFYRKHLREYYNDNNIIYNTKKNFLIKDNKQINTDKIYNLNLKNINILNNKIKAKTILMKHNIPTSKFIKFEFDNIDTLYNELKNNNIKYPVVLKPMMGHKGNGVITNIDNIDEIKNIFNKKKNKNKKKIYIIEEQIEGSNYRFYLVNNKLIDVVSRVAPNVTGDGFSTLEELIDKENKNRAFNNRIVPNYFYLNKINIYKDTILENNLNIIVNNVVNFHRGATIKHIPIKNIHIDNINIIKDINNIFGTFVCGIDIISNDISKSYKNNNYTFNIIELNGNPHDEIHWMDKSLDKNYKNKFIQKCLEEYFNIL